MTGGVALACTVAIVVGGAVKVGEGAGAGVGEGTVVGVGECRGGGVFVGLAAELTNSCCGVRAAAPVIAAPMPNTANSRSASASSAPSA